MGVRHPTSGQVPSVGWSPCPSTGLLAGELLEVSQLSPSGWGCRCSDCQEATVLQEPPCVTQTGIAPDPWLGSSPRALALPHAIRAELVGRLLARVAVRPSQSRLL